MSTLPKWPDFCIERFKKRLQETSAWCELCQARPSVPLAQILRYQEFDPGQEWEWESWEVRAEVWPLALDHLALRRSDALRPNANIALPSLPTIGKLLLFLPGQSISDEVEACETEYFFDSEGSPPWDTWVDCFELPSATREPDWDRRYVVSWIPPSLLEVAHRGVYVTCVGALRWVTAADAECYDLLNRNGLGSLLGEC